MLPPSLLASLRAMLDGRWLNSLGTLVALATTGECCGDEMTGRGFSTRPNMYFFLTALYSLPPPSRASSRPHHDTADTAIPRTAWGILLAVVADDSDDIAGASCVGRGQESHASVTRLLSHMARSERSHSA
ncbi:hypothetical protein NUW54_g5730 [Trametes sanguinea]|uniref:Uncharacterized protein n=1 Tax=Trametes sanguinea TaxID=158606 RepID=A0ACC1PVT8_9APHY|nr:hypothetical protein NUW54_g5730 [Trametes sanguinea]